MTIAIVDKIWYAVQHQMLLPRRIQNRYKIQGILHRCKSFESVESKTFVLSQSVFYGYRGQSKHMDLNTGKKGICKMVESLNRVLRVLGRYCDELNQSLELDLKTMNLIIL